jgi:hypothetical protein
LMVRQAFLGRLFSCDGSTVADRRICIL